MANNWYVKVMGEEVGPMSDSQLREMAAKRQLTADDVVRQGQSDNWVSAARVRGLFQQSTAPDTVPTTHSRKRSKRYD